MQICLVLISRIVHISEICNADAKSLMTRDSEVAQGIVRGS